MTVTLIERLAYRTRLTGRWHLSLQGSMMKLSTIPSVLGMALLMACASAPPATPPAPVDAPSTDHPPRAVAPPIGVAPLPPVPVSRTESWTFAYAPGSYVYSFKTDATVAPVTDTTLKQQVPELSQRATITISATGDVQVIDPPPLLTATACDLNGALTARAQQLIPKIPNHLTVGTTWRDSTTTTGCRGSIPAESTVISNYVVVGDTILGSNPLLRIQRTDSLSATGEGADGQHRILISAAGSAQVDLLFDFTAGRLVSLRGVQSTMINVTTSGRSARFVQHVTESVSIVGAP